MIVMCHFSMSIHVSDLPQEFPKIVIQQGAKWPDTLQDFLKSDIFSMSNSKARQEQLTKSNYSYINHCYHSWQIDYDQML